ncbi:MAG: patatin-like phospholipase family protein [Burkholderiaceae bacterium]
MLLGRRRSIFGGRGAAGPGAGDDAPSDTPARPLSPAERPAGLLLMGGGARTAYQAGVLRAIGVLTRHRTMPFQNIVGTSAGAINAAFLASQAADWPDSTEWLCALWRGMTPQSVFSTGARNWYLRGARWVSWLALPRLMRQHPESFLDNGPLRRTLAEVIDLRSMARAFDEGLVDMVGITASSYTSGRHVTFIESRRDIATWARPGRVAVRARIGLEHMLASSAIPFVFGPVPLSVAGETEFFGDGTMRQSAPLSPLIQAGSGRILAISVGQQERSSLFAGRQRAQRTPSLAQVAGHALSSIMFDALPADIEQLERINEALELLPPETAASFPFQRVDVLAIYPSRPIEEIALEHVRELPPRVRSFLATFGGTEQNGIALASYLLFEPGFCEALMRLGYHDAMAQADALRAFFGMNDGADPARAATLAAAAGG